MKRKEFQMHKGKKEDVNKEANMKVNSNTDEQSNNQEYEGGKKHTLRWVSEKRETDNNKKQR